MRKNADASFRIIADTDSGLRVTGFPQEFSEGNCGIYRRKKVDCCKRDEAAMVVRSSMTSTELAYEKGLPANLDAERFVLGSILLNDTVYLQVAGAVEPDDFSLEKHRRIFARMKDLYDRGERLDRVTVAE